MPIETGSMQAFGAPAGPGGATHAGLVLLYAPGFERMRPAYPLGSPEVTIGRDPGVAVCVPEQAVSRQHARLVYRDEAWWLRDLGSRNGTLVDGRFIDDEVRLEPMHEVRVGDAIFEFVGSGAESWAPYRLDGAMVGGARRRATKITALVGGWQMDRIAADLERIASTELPVVVLGESGTGKEVVARELHRVSGRRGPLQAINCAAIPTNLLESELFGYKRGAFSGADRDKPGLIRAADGGTLFLDEIGDMPLEAQAKLLRVLETREVHPVGATQGEKVDVRVVCATHRDLARMQVEGKFRGDLFARLDGFRVHLPPLRERKEDIWALSRHLLERRGRGDVQLAFPFLLGLLHHDWPYNVRELDRTLERALALSEGGPLTPELLPDSIREAMATYGSRAPRRGSAAAPVGEPEVEERDAPDEAGLRELLARHRGNVAAVGREVGKGRMQVHRWMKRWGIDPEEYR